MSMIHQNLVCPRALLEEKWVEIRCVNGDVHRYPVVSGEVKYRVKMHRIKAAVSSRHVHPLILGTDWSWFHRLVSGFTRGPAGSRNTLHGRFST